MESVERPASAGKADNKVFPYTEQTEYSKRAVVVRVIDYGAKDKPVTTEYKDQRELEQAINAKGADPKNLHDHWFSVHAVPSSQAGEKHLTLDQAMHVLQKRCDLEQYSVKDALTESNKTKVDHDDDSLYVSILCFSTFSPGALADLIITGDDDDKGEPVQTQVSQLAQKSKPGWERVCAFLTPHLVVTVFPEPDSQVVKALWAQYSSPTSHQLEKTKGPDFLYYKIMEVIIDHLPPVLAKYRTAILRFEDRTFRTTRPSMRDDIEQTLQLHLMSRELSVIKHYMRPSERVMATILALPTETGDNKMSVNLIDAETIDCLEEVSDDIVARLHELEMLGDASKDLVSLMFNLTAYRSTVSSQTLAGVSTLFLPLTWWCGIYGTNFAILPELFWGLTEEQKVEAGFIDGFPGGYVWFWCMTGFFLIVSTILLRYLRVF